MGVVVFMYLICSLRTNVVFFCIFLFLDIAFFLLASAYWKASTGDMKTFHTLEVVSTEKYQLNMMIYFRAQWMLTHAIYRQPVPLYLCSASLAGTFYSFSSFDPSTSRSIFPLVT